MEENKETQETIAEEIKPAGQDGQPGEKKGKDQPGDTGQQTQVVEEDKVLFEVEEDGKKIVYTAKKLKTLENKARDFDGITEKQRIEKLSGKNKKETIIPPIENEEEEIEEGDNKKITFGEAKQMVNDAVQRVSQNINTETRNKNLSEAYREFVKENPWANSDEAFEKISANFSDSGQTSKEGFIERLKIAAQNSFPQEYNKAIEEKIRSKVLVEDHQINAGDGGSGSSVKKEHKESLASKADKEDLEIAKEYFGGDVEKYMKFKNKDK